MVTDSEFDRDAALEQFREGLPEPGRTSTQSWGIETWSTGWRDGEGRLDPAKLGRHGGAFWYRALTEPSRLGDDREAATSVAVLGPITDELSPDEAVRRLRDFVAAADRELTHWPQPALAPAAFPLRCALDDLGTVRRILQGAVSPAARAAWVEWLGPIDAEFADAWIADSGRADVVEALAAAGERWGTAVERLTTLGAIDRADRLAEQMEPQARSEWTLAQNRRIETPLLIAAVGTVDDALWMRLCRKVVGRRDRDVWQILAKRPLAALVPRVLEKLAEPIAGWILDWFAMGDTDVLDALIGEALGRSRRQEAALRVLAALNDDEVRARIAALDDADRELLTERLGPVTEVLPELPRADRAGWMEVFATREARDEPWLAPRYLPDLQTRSGHRLPAGVSTGLIATLQEVRLSTRRDGEAADRFDAALTQLATDLTDDAMTAWWNALFGQWWSAERPDGGAWVLTAAGFLGTPAVIQDLASCLHQHRKWFGSHAEKVLHALRVRGTPWAIAVLDETARRGRSANLRSRATQFLQGAATSAGLTVDAFVESHLPDEESETLQRLVSERLEDSMVQGRTWSGWAWHRRRATPAFGAVARDVLWAIVDDDGHTLATFRYDGTAPVGPDDEPFEIRDEDLVAVAHPASMPDDERARWNEVFVDFELVQPFEQIARERYRHASLSADGFRSPLGKATSGRELIRTAAELGWEPTESGAHGDVTGLRRHFGRWDVVAELSFSDAIPRRTSAETRIDRLQFETEAGDALDPAFVPAVPYSETHRDLMRMID